MDKGERGVKRKSRLAVFEHVEIEKAQIKAKFKTNTSENEESSSSETDLVIDEEENSVSLNRCTKSKGRICTNDTKRKKNPLMKLSEEPLNLRCEWELCDDYFDSWEKLNSHLMEHAVNSAEHSRCQWTNCDHDATTTPLLMQHLSYHGYLSKVINIGQNVVERQCLPNCNQEKVSNIPVEEYGYTCEWENCPNNFYTIYEFFAHVLTHVKKKSTVENDSENVIIECCWAGCGTKYSKRALLIEHLRTHSKEKRIGCPTCFSIFSNNTKFGDHRRRQQSSFISVQSYQCSQCLKLFPSERLLREHIRSHINHYKCTMCDMTCTKPSLLAKHIRFKHVKDKPYECSQCDKRFVTKHNLNTHLKTHEENNPMECDLCKFSCRTRVGLDNHYVRKHAAGGLCYQCHCCKKKFKRGGYLTKHLMKLHNYHWPSGHSRFKYRRDLDGIYRLQTVRLESLEVTQEVIRSESKPTSKVEESVRYLLNYDNGKAGYVLSISKTNEQTLKPADRDTVEENNVLITIQDVDEDGNILKSEVVDKLPLLDNAAVVGEVNDKETLGCLSSFNKSTDSEISLSKTVGSESEDDPSDVERNHKSESQIGCFPEQTTILNYEMFKKELSPESGA